MSTATRFQGYAALEALPAPDRRRQTGDSFMAHRALAAGAELTINRVVDRGNLTVPPPQDQGDPEMGGQLSAETEAAGPIRVFLVDDHRVVRAGLSAYLKRLADIEVTGEAGDGRQALNRIAELEPAGTLPDVVLMDLVMPVMDGIAATTEIKGRWPAVEVVVMTSFVEEAKVRAALEAGAAGYLLKDADADQVASAVRDAVAGRMHLDPAVARLLADSVRRPQRLAERLTPRELEVLGLVATGASNLQIAQSLTVGERTARTHVSAILTKLGFVSRTQAALWAVREGLGPASEERPRTRPPGSSGQSARTQGT
jgi:DNA-binding NarL/FixJ family response regulator